MPTDDKKTAAPRCFQNCKGRTIFLNGPMSASKIEITPRGVNEFSNFFLDSAALTPPFSGQIEEVEWEGFTLKHEVN